MFNGMQAKEKFILFIVGILVTVVGAIGLAFSLGFIPAFLSAFPKNTEIYFGIITFLGLIALFSSFGRRY